MLNVALLGAGRIAGVHATAITTNPGSRLVAVSDINAEAAARLAAQYGAEVRATDDILADPAINAVLIATSTDTHSDLIERATAAGKAVLLDIREADEFARAHIATEAAETQQSIPSGSKFPRWSRPGTIERSSQALSAPISVRWPAPWPGTGTSSCRAATAASQPSKTPTRARVPRIIR